MLMGRNRNSIGPISVLAFDLDHFKLVNDRQGHAAGDSVLQLFAAWRARRCVPTTSSAGWAARNSLPFFRGGRRMLPLRANACDRRWPRQASSETASDCGDGQHRGCVRLAVDRRRSLITRADNALYRAKMQDVTGSRPPTRSSTPRLKPALGRNVRSTAKGNRKGRRSERRPGKLPCLEGWLHAKLAPTNLFGRHALRSLRRVVHFELDRMRRVFEADLFAIFRSM